MNDLRQRRPRLLDPGFLTFVRMKKCTFCGARPSQAAHIRMGCPSRGKESLTGMQRKPDDKWAVPLCQWCHLDGPESQHKIGEERFWKIAETNPFVVAEELYAEYGGDGGCLRKPRQIKPRPPKEKRAKIRSRNDLRKR